MIRYEIEHQPQPVLVQLFVHAGQCLISTQFFSCLITHDREAGAADIAFGQIDKTGTKAFLPSFMVAGNSGSGLADLPNTQEPNPIKTLLGNASPFVVWPTIDADCLVNLAK